VEDRRKLAAELLGTSLLLATVVGSGIMAEQLAGGNTALALLGNTIPTGAILFVLITIFGPVSGAHFNPVVSAAMSFSGHLPQRLLARYVLAQLIGAILGVWIAHLMFDQSMLQVSGKVRWSGGQWLAETVATFGLLLTIYGSARATASSVAPSVALYITAAYWFTASTSFANPAVSVARALTDTFAGIAPASVPPFVIAQCLGGTIAVIIATRLFGERQ
jgi:glycerol uptake facilitator-like aquaporin